MPDIFMANAELRGITKEELREIVIFDDRDVHGDCIVTVETVTSQVGLLIVI